MDEDKILPLPESETPEMPQVESAPSPTPEPEPVKPAVTSAAHWRRLAKATYLVTLPSQVVVRAKRPDISKLVADGSIKVDDINALQDPGKDTPLNVVLLGLAKVIIPFAVLEPKIVSEVLPEDAGDLEIMSVEDIHGSDLVALMRWIQGDESMVTSIEA